MQLSQSPLMVQWPSCPVLCSALLVQGLSFLLSLTDARSILMVQRYDGRIIAATTEPLVENPCVPSLAIRKHRHEIERVFRHEAKYNLSQRLRANVETKKRSTRLAPGYEEKKIPTWFLQLAILKCGVFQKNPNLQNSYQQVFFALSDLSKNTEP